MPFVFFIDRIKDSKQERLKAFDYQYLMQAKILKIYLCARTHFITFQFIFARSNYGRKQPIYITTAGC